ncbi:hypothetical protein LL584_29925 [Streptomyces malaysiensis subsp. malaysiensis]|nr:hypothetical protein [Streptomyces malaysiensis]
MRPRPASVRRSTAPRSSSRRTVAWALCAVIPARQPNSLAGQAGFAAQMPESREVPQV